MLKNAYLDTKIGFDPAENEPPKECCVVAGISIRGSSTALSTGLARATRAAEKSAVDARSQRDLQLSSLDFVLTLMFSFSCIMIGWVRLSYERFGCAK